MIFWLIIAIAMSIFTYILVREFFSADANIFSLTDDEIRMGEEERVLELSRPQWPERRPHV